MTLWIQAIIIHPQAQIRSKREQCSKYNKGKRPLVKKNERNIQCSATTLYELGPLFHRQSESERTR